MRRETTARHFDFGELGHAPTLAQFSARVGIGTRIQRARVDALPPGGRGRTERERRRVRLATRVSARMAHAERADGATRGAFAALAGAAALVAHVSGTAAGPTSAGDRAIHTDRGDRDARAGDRFLRIRSAARGGEQRSRQEPEPSAVVHADVFST